MESADSGNQGHQLVPVQVEFYADNCKVDVILRTEQFQSNLAAPVNDSAIVCWTAFAPKDVCFLSLNISFQRAVRIFPPAPDDDNRGRASESQKCPDRKCSGNRRQSAGGTEGGWSVRTKAKEPCDCPEQKDFTDTWTERRSMFFLTVWVDCSYKCQIHHCAVFWLSHLCHMIKIDWVAVSS